MVKLTDDERKDWLNLIRSERLGPITVYKLLEQFGTAKAALALLPALAWRDGAKRIKVCSKGANDLIRQGAHLTESPEEIIQTLNGQFTNFISEHQPIEIKNKNFVQPSSSEIDTNRSTVKKMLNVSPVSVDEIIRRCQMSPAVVSTVLLEIELAGQLERHPGNQFQLLAAPSRWVLNR